MQNEPLPRTLRGRLPFATRTTLCNLCYLFVLWFLVFFWTILFDHHPKMASCDRKNLYNNERSNNEFFCFKYFENMSPKKAAQFIWFPPIDGFYIKEPKICDVIVCFPKRLFFFFCTWAFLIQFLISLQTSSSLSTLMSLPVCLQVFIYFFCFCHVQVSQLSFNCWTNFAPYKA